MKCRQDLHGRDLRDLVAFVFHPLEEQEGHEALNRSPEYTGQTQTFSVQWFWRRFFKVSTIDGQGSHVGYVTQLICINFQSHFPLSFHMNSGSKSPNCF